MLNDVLKIVCLLFGIGASLILLITNNESVESKKKYWIKYIVYFIVVTSTLLCLNCKTLYPIIAILFSIIISMRSAYELWKMQQKLILSKRYLLGIQLLLCLLTILSIVVCHDTKLLLLAYTFVFVFDGFAQIGGQLLKGAKLAPHISPSKTWSGLIVGLIIAACLCIYLMQHYSILIATSSKFIFIVTCFIGSIGGDLFASYIKRQAASKDYLQLLPQHGGLLDRFDSFFGCFALLNLVLINQRLF